MRKQILLLAIEWYCTALCVNIGFRKLLTNVMGFHVLESLGSWDPLQNVHGNYILEISIMSWGPQI